MECYPDWASKASLRSRSRRKLPQTGKLVFPETRQSKEKDQMNKNRGFSMLIFQSIRANLIICVIEWWGAVYRREWEYRGWQGQGREGLDCHDTKPQFNIYPAGKSSISPILVTSGSHLLAEQDPVKARSYRQDQDHLVAGRLITQLQKGKILRAVPNPKGIQAHWECG